MVSKREDWWPAVKAAGRRLLGGGRQGYELLGPTSSPERESQKSQYTLELLPQPSGVRGRRAVLRQTIQQDEETVPEKVAPPPLRPVRNRRRAVIDPRPTFRQEVTPSGELCTYAAPHRCHLCGKLCYLPSCYRPVVRMNDNFVEVSIYFFEADPNGNIVTPEDLSSLVEPDFRYQKSLTLAADVDDNGPLVVIGVGAPLKSSKI